MRTEQEVQCDINATKNRITALNTDLYGLEKELKRIKSRPPIDLGTVVQMDGKRYLVYTDGSSTPFYGYQLVLLRGSDHVSAGLHNQHTKIKFVTMLGLKKYVEDNGGESLGWFSELYKEKY